MNFMDFGSYNVEENIQFVISNQPMNKQVKYLQSNSINFNIPSFIIMSTPSKSIRRIFDSSPNKQSIQQFSHSPQTPRRRPIFSEERKSTIRKNNISSLPKQIRHNTEYKGETVSFLEKMLLRVQSKSKLLDQLEAENAQLKRQNRQVQAQNQQVLKKIAVFSGIQKLKEKNSQYRTKLLKAEALLYQLRRSLKQPVKGLDQLISSLQI